jgi:hypothetical protein
MNSKQQLLDGVLHLADALSSLEKLAEYYECEQGEALDRFMESILDIDYTYNQRGDFKGAEITITCGGPSIWIDTKYKQVNGVWGSDRIERSYEDGIRLDELAEEASPMRKV